MDSELAGAVVAQSLDDVTTAKSLAEIVSGALDTLSREEPCPVWDVYRSVDFDEDVRSTEATVRYTIEVDPQPANLAGVWFGLYEVGDVTSTETTQSVISLTGGSTFPDDDWLFDQAWDPPGYLPTPGLRSLASRAAPLGSDIFWLVTYALTFAYSVGLAAEVIRGPAGAQLLDSRDGLGVAVGFHDGDIALLGVLRQSGLDMDQLGWA